VSNLLVGYWNKVNIINSNRECLEMNPLRWIIDQAYVVQYTFIHKQRKGRGAACGRSPADIVGSNPTGGMDICLL